MWLHPGGHLVSYPIFPCGVWVNSDSVDQHVFDPTDKVEWKN